MPTKLVWTEGLFLTQHHFQQLDRYHEELLTARLRLAQAYDWGIAQLEVDERALAAGQCRISRLVAIMPSGELVEAGEAIKDALPPRSFQAEFAPHLPSLNVYVGVAQVQDGVALVQTEGGRAGTHFRYVRSQETVRDLAAGTGEASLTFARPNIQLFFGDERRDSFETIQVARLVRTASGAVALDETYVPPIFRARSSPTIVRGLRDVLTLMTARQRSLAQSRKERSSGSIQLDGADTLKFLLLAVLNAAIPKFAHMLDAGTATPERAYETVAELIGNLSAFVLDGDPTAIPKFNHADPGPVFEALFTQATVLLGAVIQERVFEIPLERRADGVHLGQVNSLELMRCDFFVAVTGTLPESHLRERLPKLMKIASVNHIGAILNSAINGARVELEYRPPGALPMRPGLMWFRVQRTPEFWPDIASTGGFAIYHPFDPQSVAVALYAVGGES